ncbi:ATP-binding protein [Chitinivibrio alkaliphilus]|uniref:histidine kinase n=1 Tax=Chitinivibrio alkaliphilus ACht1 TaxID=1313304 RepID=U7D828_9BACT|nr:ATP-binding protein [Chitinivibrio alkaliphilus]ERP39110.1 multi-sensor hybrid histidine kinase [Chitinivibrio alkaliphilus ACht1]
MEYTHGDIQGVQEGIIVADTSGKVEYVNSKVCEMLLFSRDQLVEQPVTDIVYDRTFRQEWDHLVRALESGESVERPEIRLVCKNGAFVQVNMTCTLMKNPARGENWIVFYLIDISKEISTTKELERRNRELTRENSKLVKESTNFRRISELKTKFLGIASHELKTPLTSIKGYSELLIDNMSDELTPQVEKMLRRIKKAADKLHNVINDMLDVSRIEQNRLRLKPETVDLEKILRDAIQDLGHFIGKRNIGVEVDIESALPDYYGDEIRLHQVFTNLMSNAIKYSPDHTVVTCSIAVRDGAFHICIKDEGIGIDESEYDKIFTPFYEVSHAANHCSSHVKYMGGGTGLGLSIVKGIIQRHGGEIWVESNGTKRESCAQGSEFNIQLPLDSQIPWDDDETRMMHLNSIMNQPIISSGKYGVLPHDRDDSTESEAKKQKILIIDDDAETIEICRVLLEEQYTLLTCATGEIGLRMAFENNPDLILLNIYLPGLAGDLTCRILKSQGETKKIPVAFFSAATQDNEIEQAYASGGDDFIIKPFNNAELIDKVRGLLNPQGAFFKGES